VGTPVSEMAEESHLVDEPRDGHLELAPTQLPVRAKRLGDEVEHAHAWVQRTDRILEHDLHLGPQPPHGSATEMRDVGAIESDASGCGFDQAQDRSSQRRLAGARFSDQPHGLSGGDVQIHAGDSLHEARAAMAFHLELLD